MPRKSRLIFWKEYRTRLIADVVTGKLDVREATAGQCRKIDRADVIADPRRRSG